MLKKQRRVKGGGGAEAREMTVHSKREQVRHWINILLPQHVVHRNHNTHGWVSWCPFASSPDPVLSSLNLIGAGKLRNNWPPKQDTCLALWLLVTGPTTAQQPFSDYLQTSVAVIFVAVSIPSFQNSRSTQRLNNTPGLERLFQFHDEPTEITGWSWPCHSNPSSLLVPWRVHGTAKL